MLYFMGTDRIEVAAEALHRHLVFEIVEGLFQAALDDAHGGGDVDADLAAAEAVGRRNRGPAPAVAVHHRLALVAAGGDDALQQGEWLLGVVAQPFAGSY